MKPDNFSNNNLAKWIVVAVGMTGILYLTFFLFLLYNRQNITIPAPPDSARVVTPTSVPTTTPTAAPTRIPTPAKAMFCGGIAGRQCPAGYSCKLAGTYPDAGGTCMKKTAAQNPSLTPVMVACPMDARACPDGSYVARHGPKCEFAPCPKGI